MQEENSKIRQTKSIGERFFNTRMVCIDHSHITKTHGAWMYKHKEWMAK